MRPFFHLPFLHSELLADQERSVRLHEAFGDPERLRYAGDPSRYRCEIRAISASKPCDGPRYDASPTGISGRCRVRGVSERDLEQRRRNCIAKSHLRPKIGEYTCSAAEHSPDLVMRPYKEPVSAELRERTDRGRSRRGNLESTATSKHSGRLEEIAMTERAQRIVLASRPVGEPTLDNFRVEEIPIPQPGQARCCCTRGGFHSTLTCGAA